MHLVHRGVHEPAVGHVDPADGERLAPVRGDLLGHAVGRVRIEVEDRDAIPSAASRRAIPCPMPEPAPVTMAVRLVPVAMVPSASPIGTVILRVDRSPVKRTPFPPQKQRARQSGSCTR